MRVVQRMTGLYVREQQECTGDLNRKFRIFASTKNLLFRDNA